MIGLEQMTHMSIICFEQSKHSSRYICIVRPEFIRRKWKINSDVFLSNRYHYHHYHHEKQEQFTERGEECLHCFIPIEDNHSHKQINFSRFNIEDHRSVQVSNRRKANTNGMIRSRWMISINHLKTLCWQRRSTINPLVTREEPDRQINSCIASFSIEGSRDGWTSRMNPWNCLRKYLSRKLWKPSHWLIINYDRAGNG